jgi:hypothetical protein
MPPANDPLTANHRGRQVFIERIRNGYLVTPGDSAGLDNATSHGNLDGALTQAKRLLEWAPKAPKVARPKAKATPKT